MVSKNENKEDLMGKPLKHQISEEVARKVVGDDIGFDELLDRTKERQPLASEARLDLMHMTITEHGVELCMSTTSRSFFLYGSKQRMEIQLKNLEEHLIF